MFILSLFCFSLLALLESCKSLERVGNLDRWEILDLDTVLSRIQDHYKWKTCPVFYNSKIEVPCIV